MNSIRVLLFVFVIFSIGCQKATTPSYSKSTLDSISNYRKASKNKKAFLDERILAISSAHKLSKKLENDSLILNTIAYKATLVNAANRPNEYYKISNQYLNLALKSNTSKAIGKAYFKLGNYFFKQNKPDSAYYYFNKSKEVFITLNDSFSIGKRLLNMAIIQSNESDFYGAEKTAIEALDYLNETNTKQLLSIYNCLSITTNALRNYDDAIYWGQKTEKLQTDNYKASIIKNNKATYYLEKKDFATSQKILTELSQNKQLRNKVQLWTNIQSNLGYTYFKQNNNKLALPLLKKSLKTQLKNNLVYETIESYLRLSEFYQDISNMSEAKKNAQKAYAVALQTTNLTKKVKTLKRKLDFIEGNEYKQLSQKYIQWNDSLQLTSLKNRDLFVKIKYETRKNRSEILELNAKTVAKDLKIAQEKSTRNTWIFVASILFMAIAFMIYHWRQRIKLASFKATQKAENRISKKVHDELANDISDIRTIVEHQISTTNPTKPEITAKLDIIYALTRNIAAETGDITFVNSFGETLMDLLMQHNHQGIKITTNIKTIDRLRLKQLMKNTIYRILQELMVNMNKHSKATRVTIALKVEDKKNKITYTDNGVGSNSIEKISGLQNAENRMQEVGGSFSFKTSTGNGFRAIITFKI